MGSVPNTMRFGQAERCSGRATDHERTAAARHPSVLCQEVPGSETLSLRESRLSHDLCLLGHLPGTIELSVLPHLHRYQGLGNPGQVPRRVLGSCKNITRGKQGERYVCAREGGRGQKALVIREGSWRNLSLSNGKGIMWGQVTPCTPRMKPLGPENGCASSLARGSSAW